MNCLSRVFRRVIIAISLSMFACAEVAISSQGEDSNSFNDGGKPYRLTLGWGYTSCERYLRNLNALSESMQPLKCETKLHAGHPEFSLPEWEPLEPMENLQLIYSIEAVFPRFTITGTSPPPFDNWKVDYLKRVESGDVLPKLTTVTVKLDGSRIETLLKYEPRPDECEEAMGFGGHIVVWDTVRQVATPILGMYGKVDLIMYQGRPFYWDFGFSYSNKLWFAFGPIKHRNSRYYTAKRCEYETEIVR